MELQVLKPRELFNTCISVNVLYPYYYNIPIGKLHLYIHTVAAEV